MRSIPITIPLLLAVLLSPPALAEPGPASGPAPGPCRPFASPAEALATVQAHLTRMGVSYGVDTSGEYPAASFANQSTNATHLVRVVIDARRGLVYIFLNRYLALPNDDPARDAVLRELMKLNWSLNIGKFEWDPSDGEVRFSYCFTTENGVGYEAFDAVVRTLLQTGDRLWPELKRLTEGSR